MFLTAAELATLTGYRQKGRKLARLRQMGIPFWTNAAGQPVVARAAIEGRKVCRFESGSGHQHCSASGY